MPGSTRFISAAGTISALTLASRLLGLLRECVLGYFFSTSELLSAFRIAFMAPNLARRLFGEGALSAAMVPVLTETISARGDDASRRFVGSLLTAQAAVLIAIVLLAEVVILGWRAIREDPALELAAILMPYMALICTVAVGGAVLNVRRHFSTPAACPIILNLAIIAGAVGGSIFAGLTDWALLRVICWAVLVAGVLQLTAIGIALRGVSFFPRLSRSWRDPQIRRVMRLMGPMVLGLSAVQINSLADYLIAYAFVREAGERVGPAVLGFAQYVYQLPLGVFGIAIATAIFPLLSQKASQRDHDGLVSLLFRGMRLSLFIALPAGVGLMFVAGPLIATLLQRGAFDASDAQRVAGVLFFYSLGIPAYFAQHLVVRTYYALQNSRTPAQVAGWMVLVNLSMNLALVQVMEERGLALATSVCAYMQLVWLMVKLKGPLPQCVWGTQRGALFKMLLATSVMLLGLWIIDGPLALARSLAHVAPLRLAVLVVAGVVIYAAAARVMKLEELGLTLRRGRGL